MAKLKLFNSYDLYHHSHNMFFLYPTLKYCRTYYKNCVWGKKAYWKTGSVSKIGRCLHKNTNFFLMHLLSFYKTKNKLCTSCCQLVPRYTAPTLRIVIKQSPFLQAGHRKVTMIASGQSAESRNKNC